MRISLSLSLSVFLISAFLFERERRKRFLLSQKGILLDMNWMPKEALDFRGLIETSSLNYLNVIP